MEVVLIKAKYKELFSISETLKTKLKTIPNKIGLVSTVQFSDFLEAQTKWNIPISHCP